MTASRYRRALPRRRLALIAASMMMLGSASAAYAGTSTNLSGTITGGSLSLTAPANVSDVAVNLTGNVIAAPVSLGPWSVTDPRGTGTGYTVAVSAAAPTVDGGAIPGASVTMDTPVAPTSAGAVSQSEAPLPTTGPITLGTSGATVLTASGSNDGMGEWDYASGSVTLNLPANVMAGSLATTLTYTVSPTAA